MAANARGILFGSMGAAGLMLMGAIADLALGVFGGVMLLDIMLLLAGALVVYMAIDSLKDQK
ncbi:MAG: hypothetical protein KDA85_02820 [Planctomycetaceae bacterium]|nr:hypothetical protein [Planctomycetaceae bacterium]